MLPQPQINNLVDQFVAGPLNGGAGSEIKLFVNDHHPSASTVLADLTEASWGGYSAAGPTSSWFAFDDPETGLRTVDITATALYTATTGVDLPQVVYGFFVVSDGGELAAAQRLPQPLTMASTSMAMIIDTAIKFLNTLTLQ